MDSNILEKAQKQILDLVQVAYPQVYLVGGTAINLLYHHRISEDLDFFTQVYSQKLHREIAAFIRKTAGFKYDLVAEEKRKKYVQMAIYEFQITKDLILKVDFVSDYVKVFKPRQKNGIASIEDIYYRKMLAVIGWKARESATGHVLAGGRQKTKDLYDVFFLSAHAETLSGWFPKYFDLKAYERLTAWYLGIPKQKTVLELLDLVPDCDAKFVFSHLDEEIIHKLNRRYIKT
ncbi:MAG: nucleotidyl transferase AbiEii/AbiGii toxin family protein [Candidatus Omnitrophica bacterium]|nr:nucleotidyl transferase AbiEii/AbiGii toxin family protein [Candidatus Omnitrophota bacterium]